MVYCRYEQQCQLLGMPATSLQWAWLQPREQHQGSLPALQAVEHCKVLEVRYHAFYSEEVNPVECSMSCLTAWWSLAPPDAALNGALSALSVWRAACTCDAGLPSQHSALLWGAAAARSSTPCTSGTAATEEQHPGRFNGCLRHG